MDGTIKSIGLQCVGCRACEQSCPVHCIEMKENSEGFLYPNINENECVKCGVCLKKCPQSGSIEKKNPVKVCALKNRDAVAVMSSASGGASDIAARIVIQNNGIVYGAAYDESFHVRHIGIESDSDRNKIQSSKYVQSDIDSCYKKAFQDLKAGRQVLFTGTPCQIAGLYRFLGREYENLITIDLICHGVPSPKLFSRYVEYIESCMNEHLEKYDFRSKQKKGWGTQYYLETKTKTKTKTKPLSLDKYGAHFMSGDCYRECCYDCKYASKERVGDITIGDFWGIEKYHPNFYSTKGVSVVLVNSEKGVRFYEQMCEYADSIECALEEAVHRQGNLVKPTSRPKERDRFYSDIDAPDFIHKLKIGLKPKERIKSMLPVKLAVILKRFV